MTQRPLGSDSPSPLTARGGISSVQPPLSQAVGYVVVVVIGVIIALGNGDLGLSHLDSGLTPT